MRQEAIELVCAHVCQDQAPPPHHSDVLGMSASIHGLFLPERFLKGMLTFHGVAVVGVDVVVDVAAVVAVAAVGDVVGQKHVTMGM